MSNEQPTAAHRADLFGATVKLSTVVNRPRIVTRTDPVDAATTKAILHENVTKLVAALTAIWTSTTPLIPERTDTDVPIWFTYDLLYYEFEAPAKYVVFKINGINYFYIHPNRPSVDQVIEILPLLEKLTTLTAINPFTHELQNPRVEVGYYDTFATFHPVRGLSSGGPGVLVGDDTSFETTGLAEVLAAHNLDPQTRQLLTLTSKTTGAKFKLHTDELTIPSLPEHDPEPSNQKLWRIIRATAVRSILTDGNFEGVNLLGIFHRAIGWIPGAITITGQCTNIHILTRLIQYGYKVVNTETDPGLLKTLAIEALYIVENESPVRIDKEIVSSLRTKLTKYQDCKPRQDYTNLSAYDVNSSATLEMFRLSGYAHHDSVRRVIDDSKLTATDCDIIFTRYPYPDNIIIKVNTKFGGVTVQNGTSIPIIDRTKKLLMAGRDLNSNVVPYSGEELSVNDVITLVSDSSIDISARAELIYSFTRILREQIVNEFYAGPSFRVARIGGYFDAIGMLQKRYTEVKKKSIKQKLVKLTKITEMFKQLAGLDTNIDTAIQKLFFLLHGDNLTELIKRECLVVAPLMLPMADTDLVFKKIPKNVSSNFLFPKLATNFAWQVQVHTTNNGSYLSPLTISSRPDIDPTIPELPDIFISGEVMLIEPYMLNYLVPV